MIVIDSTVWIDYFNGKYTASTEWLDSSVDHYEIVIGDLIITEVLQGFRSDMDFLRAKRALMNFQFMEMAGLEMAVRSASNYRLLRQKGVTVRKTIDVMIGTFCIHHGFHLLHNDRDFEPMEKYLKLKTVKV